MKKIIAVFFAVVALAACGGSDGGGGSTTQQMINNSVAAFNDLVNATDALLDGGQCPAKATWDCSAVCSNAGGTLDVDDVTQIATIANCQQDGMTFSGTVTALNEDDVDVDLTQAGECTTFDGTLTDTGFDTPNCSGIMNFKCNGATGTCNMSTDCRSCTIATSDGGDTSDTGGGGSGGTTDATALAALEAAAEDFQTFAGQVPLDPDAACASGTAPAWSGCPCPVSGTFDFDISGDPVQFDYDNCTAVGGSVYSGAITASQAGQITANMTQFGQCSNVTGTINIDPNTDDCTGGSLSATCPGTGGVPVAVSCTVQTDCSCS